MKYVVTSQGSRHFKIADERQVFLGSLDYAPWKVHQAHITTGSGGSYELVPAGFWNRAIQVRQEGMTIAVLKPGMRRITLELADGRQLAFRKEKLLSSDYILLNETEEAVAWIRPHFKWSLPGFTYDIEANTLLLDGRIIPIIPFLMIYCTRLLRMRHAAAT